MAAPDWAKVESSELAHGGYYFDLHYPDYSGRLQGLIAALVRKWATVVLPFRIIPISMTIPRITFVVSLENKNYDGTEIIVRTVFGDDSELLDSLYDGLIGLSEQYDDHPPGAAFIRFVDEQVATAAEGDLYLEMPLARGEIEAVYAP
jgi:hypothetical protein